MTERLLLVDGREYEVRRPLMQVVALFDREHLAFVSGKLRLSVDEVEEVRERALKHDKRVPAHWHPVDRCFLAPRQRVLGWDRPRPAQRLPSATEVPAPASTLGTKLSERLTRFVQANPGCLAQQCADAMGCRRYSAQRVLHDLARAGVVVSCRVRNPNGSFGIADLWYHVSAAPAPSAQGGRPS